MKSHYVDMLSLNHYYYYIIIIIIYEQRKRVFDRESGISKHEKIMMNTRACSASVFVHCFRVFGHSGETQVRVVYMASQMNRDVTGCSNQAYRN